MPSTKLDRFVAAISHVQPVIVFIDPAVSFGIGESRVNDAEQGLVEAARRIRNEANCAVVFIHHTGKQNARLKSVDQYAGRGGSAFADGSRMVHVLQRLDEREWKDATGDVLADGESGLVVARPKMSHAPPQPDIFVKRSGYLFKDVSARGSSNSLAIECAERVFELVRAANDAGEQPTGRSLEAQGTGIRQKALREAIALLLATRRIEYTPTKNIGRGGAKEYLRVTRTGDAE